MTTIAKPDTPIFGLEVIADHADGITTYEIWAYTPSPTELICSISDRNDGFNRRQAEVNGAPKPKAARDRARLIVSALNAYIEAHNVYQANTSPSEVSPRPPRRRQMRELPRVHPSEPVQEGTRPSRRK